MKTSLILGMVFITSQLAVYSQQSKQEQTQPSVQGATPHDGLKVELRSVKTATNCSAYFGDGPAISAPERPPFLGGGMSLIIMVSDDKGDAHSYEAGNIEVKTNSPLLLLILECDVKNVSEKDQDFRPLDIEIGDGIGHLAALGAGKIAFVKDKAGWDKLRARKPRVVSPSETGHYIYVFSVPQDSSSWKLLYKGKQISLLKNEAKSSK